MADVYSLAGRVRGKLAQEASRKDPDIRRVLSHALLLDSLVTELSMIEFTRNENGARDEVVGSEGDSCDPEDSDDSDSDSDTDSSTDSDSGSEWHSSEDFDQEAPEDFGYESCDDCGAYAESAALDWARMEFWETAKPIAGGTPIQVSVQEVNNEAPDDDFSRRHCRADWRTSPRVVAKKSSDSEEVPRNR